MSVDSIFNTDPSLLDTGDEVDILSRLFCLPGNEVRGYIREYVLSRLPGI